jgi:hypothetical protein
MVVPYGELKDNNTQRTGALAAPVSIDFKGMPFFTGLRFVVATGNASFTIVYE